MVDTDIKPLRLHTLSKVIEFFLCPEIDGKMC